MKSPPAEREFRRAPADKLDPPSAPSAHLRAQSPSPAKRRARSQSQLPPTRTIPCRKTRSRPRHVQTAGSQFHSRLYSYLYSRLYSFGAPARTPHLCRAETAAAFRSAPPASAIHPESSPRKLRNVDSPSQLSSPPPAPTSSQSTTRRRLPAGPSPLRTQRWSLAAQRAGTSSDRRRCEPQLPFCPLANKFPPPHSACRCRRFPPPSHQR